MDPSDIQRLARLARINIDAQTASETASSISDILQLVDQLQAVDCAQVSPMAHPQDGQQRLREDEVGEQDQRAQLQASAPLVENGLYLVPKVIDPS